MLFGPKIWPTWLGEIATRANICQVAKTTTFKTFNLLLILFPVKILDVSGVLGSAGSVRIAPRPITAGSTK